MKVVSGKAIRYDRPGSAAVAPGRGSAWKHSRNDRAHERGNDLAKLPSGDATRHDDERDSRRVRERNYCKHNDTFRMSFKGLVTRDVIFREVCDPFLSRGSHIAVTISTTLELNEM